jgi:hypothetical protein
VEQVKLIVYIPASSSALMKCDTSNSRLETLPNEGGYASAPAENRTLTNIVFGKGSVPENTTQNCLGHQHGSFSPPTKDPRNLEEDLATLLLAHEPSADRAMIFFAVRLVMHMLQKDREQKSSVPEQASYLSGLNRYKEIFEEKCMRGMV